LSTRRRALAAADSIGDRPNLIRGSRARRSWIAAAPARASGSVGKLGRSPTLTSDALSARGAPPMTTVAPGHAYA
jgi:hypothetical protein